MKADNTPLAEELSEVGRYPCLMIDGKFEWESGEEERHGVVEQFNFEVKKKKNLEIWIYEKEKLL